jgi:hypothetical protein
MKQAAAPRNAKHFSTNKAANLFSSSYAQSIALCRVKYVCPKYCCDFWQNVLVYSTFYVPKHVLRIHGCFAQLTVISN